MSGGRDHILGSIRRALGRGPLDAGGKAEATLRLAEHPRSLTPARVARDQAGLVALFTEMATAASATVEPVSRMADVPAAVAGFLARENLPAELAAAPGLRDLPWEARPLLTVRFGPARDSDLASVTPAAAGVAETGTLMLCSGPASPSTLNFLPDTHVVVLRRSDLVGPYEDGWDRVRARGGMPRTVNFITGPSRSGDIEQVIQLGAHGPRRLHILLVEQDD